MSLQDGASAATTLSRGALLVRPCSAAVKKVPLFHAPGRTYLPQSSAFRTVERPRHFRGIGLTYQFLRNFRLRPREVEQTKKVGCHRQFMRSPGAPMSF